MFLKKLKVSVKKKHIEQFFFSMPKKYKYYFKKRNFFKNSYCLKRNFLSKNFLIGFKSLENIYLTHHSLISCMKFFKRFGVTYYGISGLNYRINIFPDFWLTSKPKEVRMGKGKGALNKKIYFLKKGSIIFEFNFFLDSHLHFFFMLKKCSLKLPIKNLIVYKFW